MASSAFKSTTKRASIGSSSSDDSVRRSIRRSRSLSRLPHPITPDPDYNRDVPRGKFVNTTRGSPTTPFPEISLDDLALELFSSSSINENESDGVAAERKEREGRSVSRRGEVGRWANDTASSRRKGRSVSRSRGDAASRSSASAAKHVNSSDASLRRRRSQSVARFPIRDSESDVDHFRNSSNRATVKAPSNGDFRVSSVQKAIALSARRVGRSRSHKDPSLLHDGYSSQSSALTDEESKDTPFGKNGFEKIIRAVKGEHPTEDVTDGVLYEAVRKEVRHAVQEIRTEINQQMGRNQTALPSGERLQSDQDFSRVPEKYATKLEQLAKHKQDLLTEMLLEEQRGEEMVNDLPHSRTPAIAEKPSRARKRSSERSGMSTDLYEEAERYFEDFICNYVEDTDISSFDDEISDVSSTLGGKTKERNASIREAEFTSHTDTVEMDGVTFPWLQWETSPDGSLSRKKKAHTPMTPIALQIDSEKDVTSCNSIGIFDSLPVADREVGNGCSYDVDEYLKLRNNEELLFEIYRQRNRIDSGGMLFCSGGFY